MPIPKTSGFFITLEGPEGCGKTTQAPRMAEYLNQRGHSVLLTREPGGTPIGESIRGLLHDRSNTEIHAYTEIFLFCASRSQLVHQRILPQLEQGGTVVCDRFSDSTLAYQGYGRGLDLATLRSFSDFAAAGIKPHLTLLLDLPVEVGLERRLQSGGEWNRMDALAVEFHNRVRQGYLALAGLEPERWVIINASLEKDQVWEQIQSALARFLPDA
jgi:dTMP kinase